MKVETLDRLEAIGPAAWSALHERARLRSPFLTYAWQREWTRAFAAGRRLDIRTVKDADGQLVAVLPLYETPDGVLELVGGPDVSDYLDLLAVAGREEDAWSALLASHGDGPAWVLHAVPAASPTVTALSTLAGVAGIDVTLGVEERCPVLSLPESWDAYLAGLTTKHRHEMQRKVRRLWREAPEARVSCAARPDEIERRFGEFLALHRRSRTGKARFMDERMEDFFRRAVGALAAGDGARVWFLDTATGPIASFVTLEWDGTVGLYNSGFDPDQAALSPGLVLLARLVEDAIDRGKRRFDFLRGEERYKYDFGPVPEDVYAVRIGVAPAERAP
ncbi:MAG: GNAT family N-acetyltransferase [Candidatus Rokubacteria bacterium]|nr:GNAT family N-acetyltransferase [Candidatus Rokubacteria bacterium]